jgi:hypothetical protein
MAGSLRIKPERDSLRSLTTKGEMILQAKILNAIFALSILTVGAVATASAQLPGTRMSAEIPFAFTVGEKTLPGGTYELRRIGDDPRLVYIQNVDDRGDSAIFITDLTDKGDSILHSELVFHHYGDVYFLAEIRSRYEGIARELQPSKQERRMERDLASNNKESRSESVPLAVN